MIIIYDVNQLFKNLSPGRFDHIRMLFAPKPPKGRPNFKKMKIPGFNEIRLLLLRGDITI